MVHSSTDSNFLQKVEELKKRKEKAEDHKQKDLEFKVSLKTLEKDLAWAKHVRDILA